MNQKGKQEPGHEGPSTREFEFHPFKGWEVSTRFKQKTGMIKFLILKDFSLKIPLLRKVGGVRRQRGQLKYY